MLVFDQDGVPLVNAPVKFDAAEGGHLLSAAVGGPGLASVVVRTNVQGMARAYVAAGAEQSP